MKIYEIHTPFNAYLKLIFRFTPKNVSRIPDLTSSTLSSSFPPAPLGPLSHPPLYCKSYRLLVCSLVRVLVGVIIYSNQWITYLAQCN